MNAPLRGVACPDVAGEHPVLNGEYLGSSIVAFWGAALLYPTVGLFASLWFYLGVGYPGGVSTGAIMFGLSSIVGLCWWSRLRLLARCIAWDDWGLYITYYVGDAESCAWSAVAEWRTLRGEADVLTQITIRGGRKFIIQPRRVGYNELRSALAARTPAADARWSSAAGSSHIAIEEPAASRTPERPTSLIVGLILAAVLAGAVAYIYFAYEAELARPVPNPSSTRRDHIAHPARSVR